MNSGSFTSVYVCGLLLEVTPQIPLLLLYRLARLVLVISLSGLKQIEKQNSLIGGNYGNLWFVTVTSCCAAPCLALVGLVSCGFVPYYRFCSAFCCLPGCQFGSFVSVFLVGGGESLGLHVHCKVMRVVLLAI